MHAGAAVGFFGKLPCRGDFLKRRVRDDFVAVWDDWLQQCLAESRQQMQEQWLNAYLASPIWRFVLSEGVCGTGMYAGVLVPSVDRVGRYFPLTLVAQWSTEHGALDVACDAQDWFDALEELALQAPDISDIDVFDAQVARLSGFGDADAAAESADLRDALARANFPHGSAQWHVPLHSVLSLQRAINAMALREMERTLRPLSVWWTDGSDTVAPSWLCVRGLPGPESFAAMLSGRWSGTGWQGIATRGVTRRNAASAASGARHAASNGSAVQTGAADGRADHLGGADAPPARISAIHEPVLREWGAAPARTHFILRPELGLWGLATSSADEADEPLLQAIADALHGVEDGGSLTVLAERVRHVLSAVQRQLAGETGDDLNVMVFVARGTDCALIFAGSGLAIRCRDSQAVPIIGIADVSDDEADADAGAERDLANKDIALLDLVTSRPQARVPANDAPISVRYEFLCPGDSWLLAGVHGLDERAHAQIATVLARDALDPAAALRGVREACDVYEPAGNEPLPVVLLTVAEG
jgi:type VI secretion system protein ImpM